MKTIIDIGLGTLLLGAVLLFAVSIFALPPMLMWLDQADKSTIVGSTVLVGTLFVGLLTLRFLFSGKSTLSTLIRTIIVILGCFLILPLIFSSIIDMFGGFGQIS